MDTSVDSAISRRIGALTQSRQNPSARFEAQDSIEQMSLMPEDAIDGLSREPAMAPQKEQTRLVFTVFNDIDRLWGAVRSLIDEGFEIGQLCIISIEANQPSLEGPLRSELNVGRRALLESLLKAMKPCRWLGQDQPVVATAGAVIAELGGPDCDGSRFAHVPAAITRLRESVSAIPARGTGLIVSSHDARQQSVATRKLLDHSLHWVTTHEFPALPLDDTCPSV